jgi:two-component system sensor histidine kinase RegB
MTMPQQTDRARTGTRRYPVADGVADYPNDADDGVVLTRTGAAGTGLVSLRTLNFIRWIAIAGQLAALGVVHYGLGWNLPIALALGVVVASVVLNVVLLVRRPTRGRLGESEVAAYLGFDVLQLAALLYLTGGLQNPFALLIVGPVAVSATVLSRCSTAALSALAIFAASALAFWHQPLPWYETGLVLPVMYVTGVWTAIVVGTVFFAAYTSSVAGQGRRMAAALAASQLALAREQRLSSLGALAAAAAHELGSPLSTIAVTANELVREVDADDPLAGDFRILKEEVERCRDILAELGSVPEAAAGGEPYDVVPLGVLVEAAAAPHLADDILLSFNRVPASDSAEPLVTRGPEFMHGLGNIIQNAVQFASAAVIVDIGWDTDQVRLRVRDDGRGFAPAVLDVIGEPYISSRGGEHLGLGVFIAQTLLEQTGARLAFRNARADGGWPSGAVVEIIWARDELEVHNAESWM